MTTSSASLNGTSSGAFRTGSGLCTDVPLPFLHTDGVPGLGVLPSEGRFESRTGGDRLGLTAGPRRIRCTGWIGWPGSPGHHLVEVIRDSLAPHPHLSALVRSNARRLGSADRPNHDIRILLPDRLEEFLEVLTPVSHRSRGYRLRSSS